MTGVALKVKKMKKERGRGRRGELTEHCKPAIMKKIIIKKRGELQNCYRKGFWVGCCGETRGIANWSAKKLEATCAK